MEMTAFRLPADAKKRRRFYLITTILGAFAVAFAFVISMVATLTRYYMGRPDAELIQVSYTNLVRLVFLIGGSLVMVVLAGVFVLTLCLLLPDYLKMVLVPKEEKKAYTYHQNTGAVNERGEHLN